MPHSGVNDPSARPAKVDDRAQRGIAAGDSGIVRPGRAFAREGAHGHRRCGNRNGQEGGGSDQAGHGPQG